MKKTLSMYKDYKHKFETWYEYVLCIWSDSFPDLRQALNDLNIHINIENTLTCERW